MKIYIRRKEQGKGWRYRAVPKVGRRPAAEAGAKFHVRYPDAAGKFVWSQAFDTFEEAEKAATGLELNAKAVALGLTIEEYENKANSNRTLIKVAVDRYIADTRKTKKGTTAAHYLRRLNSFLASLPKGVRFLDEVNRDVLIHFRDHLMGTKDSAPQTLHNNLMTVLSLLKKNKIGHGFSLSDDLPEPEEEPAVPYEADELKKLFAAMNDAQKMRYRFFLGTACREQEVKYAVWQDIDFSRGLYHVRSKLDVGFTPKKHESRSIKMPSALVDALREFKKKPEHTRWLFINGKDKPGDFLKKFKRIALHAGLNCGSCSSTLSVGRHGKARKIQVTCATHPVCEHHYLHRLRKTCASNWEASGVPVRTIQYMLGHKSLETTQRYLGVTNLDSLTSKIDAAAKAIVE